VEAEGMKETAMTQEILPGEALAPGSMLAVEGVSTEAGESDETFPLEASDPEAAGAAALQTAATPTADSPTTGALQNVATFFYAWDHLGTVRLVSNQDRTMLDRHDYEPFGVELRPILNQTQNTHQFTGHERDLQTGYDYMHYRFYGSTLARFLKPDNIPGALMDPQSWNLYAYVRNNPANATDPTGHLSDLFLREISASPSSDQGIGATRTADGTPPPAGQKEAEDLNDKTAAAQASGQAAAKLNLPDQIMVISSDGSTIMVNVSFDPGANQPVTQEMQRIFISVVGTAAASGAVNSVNVSATTNGTHANDSAHPSGNAIDINYVNGVHVGRPGSQDGVQALQNAAHNDPSVHRNYGPARMEKDGVSLQDLARQGKVPQWLVDRQTKLHQETRPHIHLDVEP